MSESTQLPSSQLSNKWLRRNYKTVAAIGGDIIGVLTFYDNITQQGKALACDVPYVSNWNWIKCHELSQSQIEWLKERDKEGKLSAEQKALLKKEEQRLINALFEKLVAPITDDEPEASIAAEQAIVNSVNEAEPSELNALELVAQGQIEEGFAQLKAQAEENQANATRKWRQLGELAYAVDTKTALGAYQQLLAIGKAETWDKIYLSRLLERTGSLQGAFTVLKDAISVHGKNTQDRAVLDNELGGLFVKMGNIPAALNAYQQSLRISQTLADSDPANSEWQRNLSVSHNKIGDVERAQGDLSAALNAYQQALTISQTLANSDSFNSEWQRNLSVSYERIGDLYEAMEKFKDAVMQYEKSLPIAKQLTERYPDNKRFINDLRITQRRLLVLREKVAKIK